MTDIPIVPGALTAVRRGLRLAPLVAVGFLGAPQARALDAEGSFTVLSMGTRSCSRYIDAYAERGWDKVVHSAWVAGYLTAINEHASERANISFTMNSASRDRWLLDYCQKHPQAAIAEAASALARELTTPPP